MKVRSRYNTWVIPLSYAVGAVVVGLGFPGLERRIFDGLTSTTTIRCWPRLMRHSSSHLRKALGDYPL